MKDSTRRFYPATSVSQGKYWAVPVFAVYLIISLAVFYRNIDDVFRNDYWLLNVVFIRSWENLSPASLANVAFFEMFGDIRFQPLAHLLMFFRYIIFGNEIVLYNLLNMAIHALTALYVCLLLYGLTENRRLSFLLGLVFVTLPSQFDMVIWTYHIYIILGTLLALISVFYARRYAENGSSAAVVCSYVCAGLSVLLYEPSILLPLLAPCVILAALKRSDSAISPKKLLVFVAVACAFYLLYYLAASYGLGHFKRKNLNAVAGLLKPEYLLLAFKAVFLNLAETSLLKNLGVMAVDVKSLVYVNLPNAIFKNPMNAFRIALGFFLIIQFRPRLRSAGNILIMLAAGLSYIFIISLGRVYSNDVEYVTSQPRYQYFLNAMLIVCAGLLLAPRFSTRWRGYGVIVTLFLIFSLNAQKTASAGALVADELAPLKAHYSRIKVFLKEHPSDRVFLDFIPRLNTFTMGDDIALDLLFGDKITKYTGKAGFIYDGAQFTRNLERGEPGVFLNDFTVHWSYSKSPAYVPLADIRVIGSGKAPPAVYLTKYGSYEVELKDALTGKIETYPLEATDSPASASVAVEKNGDALCLILNGKLADKKTLTSRHSGFRGDGLAFLGDYYSGLGSAFWFSGLKLKLDKAEFGCKDMSVGETVKAVKGIN